MPSLTFLINNWVWVSPLTLAGIGFCAYAWFFRDLRSLIAAAGIIACLVMSGVFYHQGEAAEHARVLAETERLNAAAIAVYQQQQREDDANLKRLQKLVDDTPPSSDRVALSAERAKRVGAIR